MTNKKQFQVKLRRRDITDKELIEELIKIANKLGKETVTMDEFNDHSQFSSATVYRRFGSWFKALEKAGIGKSRAVMAKN